MRDGRVNGQILVVDDEEKIRETYRHLLLSESFEVLEAKNGEWVRLQLLQHNNIDLILLDIRMPVVNGQPLFDLIKVYSPNVKIIVMSAYSLEDQKEIIKEADDYFNKLEGVDELLSKIKSVLTKEAVA